jgi:DNA-binding NtrC family response regulator
MKYRLSTMYSVQAMGNAQSALTACAIGRPNLAIIGFPMTDTDGLAFLGELKSQWPQLVVIIVTAHGIIREAVQAIHRGAFGYLVKPVEREELLGQVQLALALSAAAADELAMSSRGERAKIPAYDEAREEFSRRYLAKTLQRAAGCVSHAARLAKRNRSDFYKLLARHRIHPQDYKPGGPERRPTGEEP